MLRNSCFLGCFMLFPPLPRPHLIPPMAAGCLGCGPQWPPKISCPGWHPRRHSHQETSENLRCKITMWYMVVHHDIFNFFMETEPTSQYITTTPHYVFCCCIPSHNLSEKNIQLRMHCQHLIHCTFENIYIYTHMSVCVSLI